MNIVKRNGSEVIFEKDKVVNAIVKAMNETDIGLDEELAWDIAEDIELEFEDNDVIPTIETVSDRCEELLAENGRFDVSRRYILYRNERARLREQGWEMSDLQRDIYEQKYRFENESFDEFLDRISGGNEIIKKLVLDKKIMPAGRILAGRGISEFGRKVSMSNCYVLPKIEDNLDSIFDTAKNMAKTYAKGGGVGVQLSKLRPKGALVQNSAKSTTGSVSFMSIYDITTKIIGQNGRRSALMLNLDVGHPDIEEFISVKNDLTKITSANISVNVSDEFMSAVKNDTNFELKFTVDATGEHISKIVRARDLFRKLAENNYNYAEPGVLYERRINNWHLMSEDEDFEFAGVNP